MELEAFISCRWQMHAAYELVTLVLPWSNYIRVWKRTQYGLEVLRRRRVKPRARIEKDESGAPPLRFKRLRHLHVKHLYAWRLFIRCLFFSFKPPQTMDPLKKTTQCIHIPKDNLLWLYSKHKYINPADNPAQFHNKERVFVVHKAFPALCNLEITVYWHILPVCNSLTPFFFFFADNVWGLMHIHIITYS